MVMSIKAFLKKCEAHPGINADDAALKKAIEGNICRCTGYVKIVDAIESLMQDN